MNAPEAQVLIRRADPEDAAGIASILRQSFLEYQDAYTPEGFAATTPDAGRVRDRMSEGPTWVASLNGSIAGTVSVVHKDRGELYIRGMAVVPSARGRRIGELLLREIESFATGNGCTRMVLSTTPFLDNAICLYERFGFQRAHDGPNDLFGTPIFSMAKVLNSCRNSEHVTGKEDLCRKTTDTPPAFA